MADPRRFVGPPAAPRQLVDALIHSLMNRETLEKHPLAASAYEPSVVEPVDTNSNFLGMYVSPLAPERRAEEFRGWQQRRAITLQALLDKLGAEGLIKFFEGDRITMAERAMNDPAALAHEFGHRAVQMFSLLPKNIYFGRHLIGEEDWMRLLDATKYPDERPAVVEHFKEKYGKFDDVMLTTMLQDRRVLGGLNYMEKRAQEATLRNRSGYKPDMLTHYPSYKDLEEMMR